MSIEKPPAIQHSLTETLARILTDEKCTQILKKIDNDYLYWDKAKYMIPKSIDKAVFWQAVQLQRNMQRKPIQIGSYNFFYTVTERMHELLHEFDLNFGGNLETSSILPPQNKKYYLISSIMEEAIASSQMEGASTTRKVAKEMLRKSAKPQNKDQQMIVNNYETIRYLLEKKEDELSIEMLLQIHSLISAKTLDNTEDEGKLRTNNDILVVNSIDGEIAHTPPSYKELSHLLQELCNFANTDTGNYFIHPIIKAICIHFFFSYIHPFVDGNGRTARSLVYWYLLKKGYWLTEYLSISRIIYRSKAQYEKAFLYTETDNNDVSYFIQFNLDTMKKAYLELREYLDRKIAEQRNEKQSYIVEGLNERQIQILKIINEKHSSIFVCKEIETLFGITSKTARADLEKLVDHNFIRKMKLNKRLVGYANLEGIRGN